MCIGLHVKYPLFLSNFNETCNMSTDFRKIFKCQILLNSFPWEWSCSMRTDWHDKDNSRFCNFVNVHKKYYILPAEFVYIFCVDLRTNSVYFAIYNIDFFIDAFAKLWKTTVSFVISVCPPAFNNWAPTGRIFMKLGIWVFFKNLPEN